MTELNASDGSWERTLYGFNEPGRIAVDGTHVWVPNSSEALPQTIEVGGSAGVIVRAGSSS